MNKYLIFVLIFVSILIVGLTNQPLIADEYRVDYEAFSNIDRESAYGDYLGNQIIRPNQEYVLDYQSLLPESFGYQVDMIGDQSNVILSDDTSLLHFEFNDVEEGYYNIKVRYYPIEGKSGSIEINILVNGELPFDMASQVIFKRIWANESNDFVKDQNGNEIVPKQIEAPRWIDKTITDANGYYEESLLFHFNEGSNTLSIEAVREPMAIASVTVYQEPILPTYQEYISESRVSNVPSDFIAITEGEHMYEKTAPTIYPITDRTSPITSPQHHAMLRLNAGGGINYRLVGDWISY